MGEQNGSYYIIAYQLEKTKIYGDCTVTNEELAVKVKDGQSEYLLDLWEGVQRLTELQAKKYNRPDLLDDMLQEAFLVLQEAADGFDPAAGRSFIGWYIEYYAPKAFRIALYGSRSRAAEKDPLNNAVSLDQPLNTESWDDREISLVDQLLDPEAESYYRHIEDLDYWRSIGELIQEGIDRITNPGIHQALQFHYDHDTTLRAGSDQVGVKYSTWTFWYKNGLQQLRRYILGLDREARRHAGLEDYLESCGYYATGRRAYERNGFTSSTEKLALKRIEMLERVKRMDDLAAMIKR